MPILDPLVLAADVSITPVTSLPPLLQARLKAERGDHALTRLRGRAPARIVGQLGASLLRQFQAPCRVADAVIACAALHGMDPDALLGEAFPLLHETFNNRFLVEAGSAEASRTLPTRERGDRIGRFEVLRCLQVISDSELYQARDRDGSMRAIKLARPGPQSRDLFSREIAALRHCDGRAAPSLVARGRHEGRPWFAMSWCPGISPEVVFAELRADSSAGAPARMIALARRIARTYGGLHLQGVIHGDVHAHNLLIDHRQAVRLFDFGLAEAIAPLRLGGRARRGGVPQFMAPEHAAAVLATGQLPRPTMASEQYAVATLLYMLIAGAHPLELSLDRTTMLRQITANVPLRFAHRGAVPWPALERILTRALAKRPEDRFKSMNELARALGRVPSDERQLSSHTRNPARPALDDVVDAFVQRVDYGTIAFRRAGRAPTCSVMLGRTGVAYALYRLGCVRDDARLLALADAWLTRIEHTTAAADAFEAPADGLDDEGLGPVSPFHSLTGVEMTRALIALATGDSRAAAAAIGRFVARSAAPWPRIDLTLGRGGVPHACALLLEALPDSMVESRVALQALGRQVLGELWGALDEMTPIGPRCEFDGFGIAHGWAGLLHTTLRWHRVVGDRLPGSLPRRLSELAASAEAVGRGVHWPQAKVGPTPSVLAAHEVAGWCNGPAGFVHLWTMADVHFPDMQYGELAESSAWTAWEARSEFFDLCCGLTGRAFAMLNLYRHTGSAEWLDRATALATRAGVAFKRQRLTLPRPLSLFKGEPGLALLAEELCRPESAAFPFFEPEGFPLRVNHV